MAVTVFFFAMVLSEDTAARLDMLRRGLIVGAMIASLAAIAGYFNLVPGGHDLLTLYERARGTFKDPNVLGAFLILPALFAAERRLRPPAKRCAARSRSAPWRLRSCWRFPARPGAGSDHIRVHAGADGPDSRSPGNIRASWSWRWSPSLSLCC